jgi:hypothetical protein
MKTFDLGRYALGICAAAAVLSGCGGSPEGQAAFSPAHTVVQPQNRVCGFGIMYLDARIPGAPEHTSQSAAKTAHPGLEPCRVQ